MRISAAILRRKGACADQVKVFEDLFGTRTVEVTEALCVEHASRFDWDWAARNLLPAPLSADYEAKCAPLLADYEAKCAPLLADYQAKRASLLADYEAKRASLWADYEAKCASLFGRLAEQT